MSPIKKRVHEYGGVTGFCSICGQRVWQPPGGWSRHVTADGTTISTKSRWGWFHRPSIYRLHHNPVRALVARIWWTITSWWRIPLARYEIQNRISL